MITIVDYGVGNIASLVNMLDYLGFDTVVSNEPDVIARATKLILPGIGAFDRAMATLEEQHLVAPIHGAARSGAHVLGICLGMQLLANHSQEGELVGLGLIDAEVVRIELPAGNPRKVPNMGWCEVQPTRASPIFPAGLDAERYYFAHSYHMRCNDPGDVAAIIDYGQPLCVAVSRGTVHGAQFHPEKSHRFGMRLLSTFGEI